VNFLKLPIFDTMNDETAEPTTRRDMFKLIAGAALAAGLGGVATAEAGNNGNSRNGNNRNGNNRNGNGRGGRGKNGRGGRGNNGRGGRGNNGHN